MTNWKWGSLLNYNDNAQQRWSSCSKKPRGFFRAGRFTIFRAGSVKEVDFVDALEQNLQITGIDNVRAIGSNLLERPAGLRLLVDLSDLEIAPTYEQIRFLIISISELVNKIIGESK